MVKYNWQRLLGACCLILLIILTARSYKDVPAHWGRMPATEYVADHPGEFEGKEIIVDGTVSDLLNIGDETTVYLNPIAKGLFSCLPVKAKGHPLTDGQSGVNVRGTVRNGVLEADTIKVSPIPGYMESLFNLSGFFFFLFFSLKEWKIKKKFPYIEEAS